MLQQASHLATTLDPKKYTVDFYSSQTFTSGEERDVVSKLRARHGPDPQHNFDPPDTRNKTCVNTAVDSHTHLDQPMCGTEEAEMSEEEESMIQETPMVLMADINSQQN